MLLSSIILAPATLAAQNSSVPSPSAFEIRGLKGLFWEGIDKYYKAVPWMADHNMNWLMLCYTAYPESGTDWRADYSDQHLAEMKELVTRAGDKGITVSLSFNPGIWSKPPLCHSCEEDYQAAWRKVKDAHSIGIYSIALCLDDIARELLPADKEKYGTLQEAQVDFVNRMWRDIQSLSPRPQFIFCPSAYTTDDMKRHMDYTLTIGEKLAPGIEIFWTGPTVVAETITVADTNLVAGWLKRKPFIWDNYPVNDMFPWRPLLAPIDGRDANLAGAVSGILFNPMKQWEANKIPLVSVADYLSDPAGYNPAEADGKVLAEYPAQDHPAIRLLTKYYGSSFVGEKNYPPGPQAGSNNAEIVADLKKLQSLMRDGSPEMQALWADVKDTVEADLKNLEIMAQAPVFGGEAMSGGAMDLAEKAFGHKAALVYAKASGKSQAEVVLSTDSTTASPTRLRLFARNGDGKKPNVKVSLNGQTIVEGITDFSQSAFEAREFSLPADNLSTGSAVLKIENLEPNGVVGSPPWFAVKWVQLLQ